MYYPPVTFNNNIISTYPHQKHLGVVLDSKLDFNIYIEQKTRNCNKIIGLIRRLSICLPRKALLTIYKSFVRPHLDYGDILYDKPGNLNFESKIEKVQYKACIAITGAIQGTSRERLYDELSLMPLSKRRWYNKLIFFYKIVNGILPDYLHSCIGFFSQNKYPLRSVSSGKLKCIPSRTKSFSKTCFPLCIEEWNKLNPEIRNAKSIYKFKKSIITEKLENSLYYVHDPIGVKLLSRLRLQFTHLNEYKFIHGFNDTVNPMCPCGTDVETTEYFLLRCHYFSTQRSELLDHLYRLDLSFSELNTKEEVLYLLYDSRNKSSNLIKKVTKLVIRFFKSTGRFNEPLVFLTNEMSSFLQYLLQKWSLRGVLENGCSWNSKT